MKKTFDQKLQLFSPEEMQNATISCPAKVLRSFVVMEPVVHQGITRVSVTARDENMNVLWQTIASEGLLPPGETTPVAFLSAMRSLIREFLDDPKPRHEVTDDPYVAIDKCIFEIERLLTVAKKKTVGIKYKKEEAHIRANAVADVTWDCLRQLTHSLKSIGITAGASDSSDSRESDNEA